MSLRKGIYISLLFSALSALIVSFTLLYFIYFRLINIRITEAREFLYKGYGEILKTQEKNLMFLDEKAILNGKYYYTKRQYTGVCNETFHYRVLSSGPYYGINKLYSDGCYFIGINFEEILRLTKDLLNVDWVVYYYRNLLEDALEEPMDNFVRGKIVIGNMVIDKFSDDKVLHIPLNVSGYTLHGSFLEKKLLIEVPFTNLEGLQIGKIILIKDMSDTYRETYTTLLILGFYSLLITSFLAFVLFRITSQLVNKIIFLRDITANIERMDFSVISLLENFQDGWYDELRQLRHSIHSMASSLKFTFEKLKEKQKELEQLAFYDPLTNLPNRRFFFEHATLLLEGSKRYKNPLTILIMDIDNFKKINDTYGHEAGDIVLKNFANILKENVRQSDLPARLGGEEFVLLMPNTDLEQGKIVAKRIKSAFQNSVVVYKDKEIKTTLSGGLSSLMSELDSIDDLIRRADEALYRAKELGKNRIEIYYPKK